MDTDIGQGAREPAAGITGTSDHQHLSRTVIRRLILFLLAVAGVLLATQHWTHISPFIPYAILLVCPLMHFFGHGRHGHGKRSPDE